MATTTRNRRALGVLLLASFLAPLSVLPSQVAGADQSKSTPFKIGYMDQVAGGQEDVQKIPAFTAWVKWTNAHGGINGHPVELVSRSEPGDPGIALSDAKQLISQGVIALVDGDGNDTAWAPEAEQAHIPVFETVSGSVAFLGSTSSFSVNVSPLYDPAQLILTAKKVGVDKVAVYYCTEIANCSQAVPAFSGVGKTYGVDVVFSEGVSSSAPDYTAQCLNAKSSGAQGVIVAATSQTALRVMENCAHQGYTPRLVAATGAFDKSFLGQPGTDGLIAAESTVPFFDTKVPGIATMTSAFDKYEPAVTRSPAYSDEAVLQWTTGLLIGAAAKAGGVGAAHPLTSAALIDGVYDLKSTTLGGLTPTLTFTKGTAENPRCWFYAAIVKNKFTTPYGLTATCVPRTS